MRTRSFLNRATAAFWDVTWEGRELETTSGKLGKRGRASSRTFASDVEVGAWIEKAIAEKLRSGFEEVDPKDIEPAEAVADQTVPAPPCDDLGGVIARLAGRRVTDDPEQAALDLGYQEAGAERRWTSAAGQRQGGRLVGALRKACGLAGVTVPSSLSRSLAAWGALNLRENLLEGLAGKNGFFGPRLPLDRLWEHLEEKPPSVDNHEALVAGLMTDMYRSLQGGTGYVHVGRRPARGLACTGSWDDPMLLAAADLGTEDEPPWLVYLPRAGEERTPAVLPLALDFDGVLLLHLTGVFGLLCAGEPTIERGLTAVRNSPPEVRPVLRAALDGAERAAAVLASRDDVRVPGAYSLTSERGAAVATLRQLRVAERAAADPECTDWLDVTFVGMSAPTGATPVDVRALGATVRAAIRAREAPPHATAVMKRAFIDGVGSFVTDEPPVFVEGACASVVAGLRAAGLRALEADPLGDIVRPSSLTDGAAHVLERVKQLRQAL